MTSKRHRTFDVRLDGILMSIRCTFDVEPRVFGGGISVVTGVDVTVDIGASINALISASTSALISASTSARTFDVMLDGTLMSVRCTFDVEPRAVSYTHLTLPTTPYV